MKQASSSAHQDIAAAPAQRGAAGPQAPETTAAGSTRAPGAAVLLATFFGAGYFPLGPGTLASAVVVALFAGLWPAGLSPLLLLPLALALALPAAWSAGVCEKHWAVCDPERIVIDEVVGQIVALAAVARPGTGGPVWKYWLLGFILFRTFDILKPFPIRRAERLPGGWGVVTDDILAGVYAFAVLQAAIGLGA